MIRIYDKSPREISTFLGFLSLPLPFLHTTWSTSHGKIDQKLPIFILNLLVSVLSPGFDFVFRTGPSSVITANCSHHNGTYPSLSKSTHLSSTGLKPLGFLPTYSSNEKANLDRGTSKMSNKSENIGVSSWLKISRRCIFEKSIKFRRYYKNWVVSEISRTHPKREGPEPRLIWPEVQNLRERRRSFHVLVSKIAYEWQVQGPLRLYWLGDEIPRGSDYLFCL